MKDQSIPDLVANSQAGSREAFGELYSRFERAVFAIALRRLGDYDEAQDLRNDVFIQVMEKLSQLRDPECFGGWLRSITHRMAINKAVRRGPALPTEPETLAATCVNEVTPLMQVLRREEMTQLREGRGRLREIDRDALDAFYDRHRTLLQMSEEFDAPVGTIKRRLHVAKKRLAKEIEETVNA